MVIYVWSMGAHDRKVPVSLFKKTRDFAAKLTQFGVCSSRQSVRQLSHVTLTNHGEEAPIALASRCVKTNFP